jgi:hypothetical protein
VEYSSHLAEYTSFLVNLEKEKEPKTTAKNQQNPQKIIYKPDKNS